jgi:tetratricopeptide (TPR) repeat protein
MAITGGAKAQQYCQLGCGLYNLGQRLAAPYCFQSAQSLLKAAKRFADGPYPEALLQEGIVLFAANRFVQAVATLGDTIAALQEGRAPPAASSLADAHFYLGLAHARTEDYDQAVRALQTFVQLAPHDDRAGWVQEYLAEITPAPVSNK